VRKEIKAAMDVEDACLDDVSLRGSMLELD
jgi:hypothetical protein